MKKLIIALAILIGLSPIVVEAVNITVPSAPSSGYFLTSTTTGAWIATSTPYFSLGWTIGATSTGSEGINLTGGCFAISGACISGSDGAVTSVSAIYPLSSSGGTTPVISSATSSASSAGILSAADWTTFNSKLSSDPNWIEIAGYLTPTSTAGAILTASSTVVGNFTATGFINTSGTTGGYQLAGNLVLYASTTNTSLAVGASGAAAWMSATSSPARNSVAVGQGALATAPTSGAAINNTAIGFNALDKNTTGTQNNASGNLALFQNTTGSFNSAMGNGALDSNTTGQGNTANGNQALFSNISGSFNTVYGFQSGNNVTGSRNVLIGPATIAASFGQVTTGSNNISIGNDVAVASSTLSNQLDIGNLIYGTTLSGTGSTISTGNIGIGTTTPLARFDVAGTNNGTVPLFQLSSVASFATTTQLIVTNAGNVGIGTSTPGSILSVQGVANFTTATSTFYGSGGINLAAGCYAILGTCIGNSGSGTVNSGTAGQNTYYAANGTTVSGTSSLFIAPNQFIGIGTTTPQNQLTVLSDAANNAPMKAVVTGTISTNNAFAALVLATQNNSGSINDNSGPALLFQEASSTGFYEGLGDLLVRRSGADNTGKITLRGYTAGVAGNASLDMNGATGFSGFASSTPGFLFTVGNVAGFASNVSATSTIWSSLVVATSSPNAFVIADQYGTQDFRFSTASSTNNQPRFQIIATSSNDTLFQVDQYGHLTASSTPKTPTVSSCGTGSPSVDTGSTDDVGGVTTGTAASSCTITFGAPLSATPRVFVTGSSIVSFPAITSESTTGFTIGISGAVTGDDISYWVIMP